MNPWRSWLVLSIGIGVGLSILLGTLRLKRNWKLNPMIYITLILAVGPAIYLQWGNPQLKKLVPLAWDIGVVATGPVTVPITLALGSGIAQGSPALAKNPLSGFGLVALASLYPIITVQSLIMLLSFLKSRDDLLIEIEILLNAETTSTVSIWDQSPLQEVILSVRSILPLAGLLLAILLLAVRESLPELSWYQILKADRESREDSSERAERQKKEDEESHGSNLHLDEKGEITSEEIHEDSFPPLKRSSSIRMSSASLSRSNSFLKRSTSKLNRSTSSLNRSSSNLNRSSRSIKREESGGESDEDSPRRGDSPSPRGRGDNASDEEDDTRGYSPPPRGRGRGGLTDDEEDLPPEERQSSSGFFDSWRISIDGTRAHLEQHYNQHHQEEPLSEPEESSIETSRDSLDYDPSRDSIDQYDSELDSRRFSFDSQVEEEEAEKTLEQFESLPVHTSRFEQLRAKFATLVRRHSVFLLGLVSVQIGCLLFNWGIVYGLSPLSLQVGGWLPTAYMHVNGVSASPKYEYAIGVLFILFFGFLLGALVTLAEPGMAVFCRQVTSLTRGEIETTFLLTTVSIGVGGGLSLGMLTLVFHIPTLYIVLIGYPIAVLFTMFTPNVGLAAVAWDAAGTVTGPVTTPLVLSIGLAFGLRDPLVDGFGVLTCAAIFPIISILFTKKVLDVFSGLKERARLAPVKPGHMGVLSATLRWDEDEAERKKKRRERRRRRRRRRARKARREAKLQQELEMEAHDSDPHDSDHAEEEEDDDGDDDSDDGDEDDELDLDVAENRDPTIAATEPGLERD